MWRPLQAYPLQLFASHAKIILSHLILKIFYFVYSLRICLIRYSPLVKKVDLTLYVSGDVIKGSVRKTTRALLDLDPVRCRTLENKAEGGKVVSNFSTQPILITTRNKIVLHI